MRNLFFAAFCLCLVSACDTTSHKSPSSPSVQPKAAPAVKPKMSGSEPKVSPNMRRSGDSAAVPVPPDPAVPAPGPSGDSAAVTDTGVGGTRARSIDSALAAVSSAQQLVASLAPLFPQHDSRTETQTIDANIAQLVIRNESDRAVTVSLDGPRDYEMNVGHRSDVSLSVTPGTYSVRMAAPSIATRDKVIQLSGGQHYQLVINAKTYEPH